jgi:para-nitrobenzyl esterase
MAATIRLERDIPGLGSVRGAAEGDIVAFRSIPYAAPPVGELRFALPAPPLPWNGVRDATKNGPVAPQTASRVDAVMGAITAPQAENCLSLAVWTPADSGAKLPVLVWLHGGGYLTGAGSLPWYDGGNLASRHGMVVVGVNYRLGALGFLSVPGHLPDNLAIHDELAALRWVRDHIADFGGDPRRVTVFGQSGGAHNITSLLAMDGREELFQRAILQSPPLAIDLISRDEAMRRGAVFLRHLGLTADTPELVRKLRAFPVKDLLEAQVKTMMELVAMTKGDLRPPFLPTDLAPHDFPGDQLLERAAANAAARGIDLMIGWTRDEANLYVAANPALGAIGEDELKERAAAMCGAEASAMIEAVRRDRPGASPGQIFLALVTETSIGRPCLRLAEHVVAAGGRAFVYRFDWQSPDPVLGACHCLELPFVFGTWRAWSDARLMAGADKTAVQKLSSEIMRRWAGFAAAGDPGFPPWRRGATPIMRLDTNSSIEIGQAR